MLSDFDRQNIGNLLAGNLVGNDDWFTSQLLRLIAKADDRHRELLRLGFPEEVAAVEVYRGLKKPEAAGVAAG